MSFQVSKIVEFMGYGSEYIVYWKCIHTENVVQSAGVVVEGFFHMMSCQ